MTKVARKNEVISLHNYNGFGDGMTKVWRRYDEGMTKVGRRNDDSSIQKCCGFMIVWRRFDEGMTKVWRRYDVIILQISSGFLQQCHIDMTKVWQRHDNGMTISRVRCLESRRTNLSFPSYTCADQGSIYIYIYAQIANSGTEASSSIERASYRIQFSAICVPQMVGTENIFLTCILLGHNKIAWRRPQRTWIA